MFAQLTVCCRHHDLQPEQVRSIGPDRFVNGSSVVAALVLPVAQHAAIPDGMLRIQVHGPPDQRAIADPVAGKGDVRAHVRIASGIERVERDSTVGLVQRRGDFLAEQQDAPG